jgi:microcystin-dependent protein
MAGSLYYPPLNYAFDQNGVPAAGYQLLYFQSGTSTPAIVYADINLTVPLGSTVVANAAGQWPEIWLSPSLGYRVQLWTNATVDNPTGSLIWSADNVGPGASGALSSTSGIIGEVRDFAGLASAIPAAWYVCAGQAVSRVTYAALFSIVGTSWGAGDGSTTFNLPDLRGRVTAGLDNMGGSAASRITSGVAGVQGGTLGATGGSQATQAHNHALTDPGHVHVVSDPTHTHLIAGELVGTGSDSAGLTNWTGGNAPNVVSGPASTGITVQSAVTGITVASYGAGNAQNCQPMGMVNKIIYAGV